MSIRIDTHRFLQLLAELSPTMPTNGIGGMPGILLHTVRGHYGTDPGLTSLLVGTSSAGRAAGHTHVPCEGTLEPTLITVQDVAGLRSLLTPREKTNPDHALDIDRDLSSITLREPADLFSAGDAFTLHVGDLDTVPRLLWTLLAQGPQDWHESPVNVRGDTLPATPRVDIPAGVLAPFLAVAKLRKQSMQLYMGHPHRPILIQIGPHYRGVLTPDRWAHDMAPGIARREGDSPDADVHPPALPPVTKRNSAGPTVIDFRSPAEQPELPIDNPTDPDPDGDGELGVPEEDIPADPVKPARPAFEPTTP
jgi:S-DNA-T family DNA segregation ATPase FtsK/SpoIIIE